MTRRRLTPIASLLVALAVAPAAAAETRYAAKDGGGDPGVCSQIDPCALGDAVEDGSVADGDTVQLLPGEYLESDEVTIDKAITVRGGTGFERPLISTTAPTGMRLSDPGARLRLVSVAQTGGDVALAVEDGTAEAVSASSDAGAACAVGSPSFPDPLLRDSTCWSDSPIAGRSALVMEAAGPQIYSASVRNVTAYGTGPGSYGINATAVGGGSAILDARNTIASGTGAP